MQNIHSYMMFGWETGILNEFHTLRRNGMPLAQLMELVMFSQLYAGMRGLGHVYRAVGDLLPVLASRPDDPRLPGRLGGRSRRVQVRARFLHASSSPIRIART